MLVLIWVLRESMHDSKLGLASSKAKEFVGDASGFWRDGLGSHSGWFLVR